MLRNNPMSAPSPLLTPTTAPAVSEGCKSKFLAVLLLMLAMCFGTLAQGAPGDLETTFGTGGKVTTDFANRDDQGRSVAVQSDGRIVVAGSSFDGNSVAFALVRYNADGSLDTSFNGTGKVTTGIQVFDYGLSVALQSDGKIVVAGSSYNSPLGGGSTTIAVVRYNANGSLDTTFGGTGKVTTDFPGNSEYANSIAVQVDGKIVVAGASNSGNTAIALVRYNTDGSLDTSFGGTGKITTVIAGIDDAAESVALQSDGKIVVAGFSSNSPGSYQFALARYNVDGSLDNSFGGTGKVTTMIASGRDVAHSLAVQTDGKIVVAGVSNDRDFAVARYNLDGSLDASFGGSGKVTTASELGQGSAHSVAVQADGKIVLGGYSSSYNQGNIHIAILRYNANGSLDTNFGGTGQVTTLVGQFAARGEGIVVQNDGRITVAGYAADQNNGYLDFAVARFLGDSLFIAVQPQGQIAIAGQSATFAVSASGSPNPAYQWRFNGTSIPGATGSSLTLSNVQLVNAGSYSVVVTNPSGQIASAPAKLTVHSNLAPVVPALPSYTAIEDAEPGKNSLVFITHGRTENGPANFGWLDTMKETIKLNVPANWMVLSYKWEENSRHWPGAVLGHAQKEGANVGQQILDIADSLPGEKWEHIHLIGHSAGSELIEEASRVVKAFSPTTIIHTTFLDPYTGATDDRRGFYGQHSDWSDNYFTFSTDTKDHWALFGRRTFGRLPNSHNVDVTGLDPASGLFAVYLPSESSTPAAPTYVPVSTHGWPYTFYTATVPTNQIPGGQGYGFPLSKEGGGWANRASFPIGNVPVVLGGTSGIDQGAIPLNSNGYINLTALPYTIGSTGSIQFTGGSFTASTGGTEFAMAQARSIPGAATTAVAPSGAPAWTSIAVELTSAVNYVSFNAEFTSAAGAVGLLSVFWNDQKIGEIDERNVLPGVQSYFFEVDGSYTDRNNSLGFRLDQFSAVISTVSVSNVTTGYGGVSGPMNLAVGKLPANPAPILTLTGLTNYTYLIEASEDLLNWEPMAAVTLDAGVTVSFEDLDAHLFPKRFYRAVSP